MEENYLCFHLPPRLHDLLWQPVLTTDHRVLDPRVGGRRGVGRIPSFLMGSFDLPLEIDKNKVDTLQVFLTDTWQASLIDCDCPLSLGRAAPLAGIINLLEGVGIGEQMYLPSLS